MLQIAFAVMIFVSGLLLGIIVSKRYTANKISGVIWVVQPEEDEPPYLFLEIYQNHINDIRDKNQIILEVTQK